MYFTPSQKKAILFVLIIFGMAAAYRITDRMLHPVEPYDFSVFEQAFYSRLDSIKHIQSTDSLQRVSEKKNELPRSSSIPVQTKQININTASVTELTALPRIGPKIAQRIVEYRQQHGPFRTKKEITNVKGIGPKTYARLKDFIRLE